MRPTTLLCAALAALSLAATAQAQPPRAGRPIDREAARERIAERRAQWQNLTPEQREAKKTELKARREAHLEKLGPAMRTWVDARNAQVRSTAEQVKAGTLTREQARTALRDWMTANPRPANARANDGTP
ncbi:MAG: hypothetical protein MUF00_00210 [Gemmatimonadaceae bacterium]|jgi:hypothetical protein|nr:hypothetical protein [Gemmatimonadaceae bacterium]